MDVRKKSVIAAAVLTGIVTIAGTGSALTAEAGAKPTMTNAGTKGAIHATDVSSSSGSSSSGPTSSSSGASSTGSSGSGGQSSSSSGVSSSGAGASTGSSGASS